MDLSWVLPSLTVASSDGVPARGTMRSEVISPATVTSWRGWASPMGVTPGTSWQNWRSRSRSRSASDVVSRWSSLRKATPRASV